MKRSSPPAAGLTALNVTWQHARRQTGIVRALKVLSSANQVTGFDCPGCAWPDPDHRSPFEFCENGAKAILDEATTKRVTADFLATHSIDELFSREESWLNARGRIVEPFVARPGATHYEPVSYEEAYDIIANELMALERPSQAAFYTSGRTSNEAAFLYQLMVRAFGTNNLPDCSNLCHESSGVALKETLGIGKGTVRLRDFDDADLIFVVGQNPGTNHPRMLTALRSAKLNGATIVSVNPLIERGLVKFSHPQEVDDLLKGGMEISDHFVRVRVNGDQALFRGINKALLAIGAVDRDFVESFCTGFEEFRREAEQSSWEVISKDSGIAREEIERLARLAASKRRIICTWAMGLTQHHNAVVTIQEITNFLLLGGHMGRPGAGACPVRGHSNVQGDRTVGIATTLPTEFEERQAALFGVKSPPQPGLDTVGTILGLRSGELQALVCLGGNFLSASPDTRLTEEALRSSRLTAHVSTKLNKSHFAPGKTSLILPCLARSERDGETDQFVSVENSMGIVHASRGTLSPASQTLRSEIRIVSELAEKLLGARHPMIPFAQFAFDYDAVRDAIEKVVPGFEGYNDRVRQAHGFELPNGPRQRRFGTPSGKACFIAAPLGRLQAKPGELVLMTIRSHDQFNTTVYSNEDRYRGIRESRHVLFLNSGDMSERGLVLGQKLRVTSHFDEETRRLESLVAHPYDIPRGTAAAYFPEANPLFFLQSMADRSRTPTSKSVRITVEGLPDRD